MLSTDKQTNKQTDRPTDRLTNATKNITSFAKEVIKIKQGIWHGQSDFVEAYYL